jgi:hypothetical protein
MSAIQKMHDIEVGGGLAWPENGRILIYLGCPLDPVRGREAGEAMVDSFAEAEAWLCRRLRKDYGRKAPRPERARSKPIVQRLFAAGVPGSVYWIYDSAFGVSLGDREDGVSSWAEAEAWFREQAPTGI